MTEFIVVTGMIFPQDRQGKVRPGVVLGMLNGRVIVAPVTSRPARGEEPFEGSVLMTNRSPAYEKAHFHAEAVSIGIKDAALYRIDSFYVKNCRQIGVIDTTLDKRLGDSIRDLMKQYDLYHCTKSW